VDIGVFALRSVSSATACGVAGALSRWERKDENQAKLYGCDDRRYPHEYLKMHRFEGWSMRISGASEFRMSRSRSSFYVIGTDFPVAPC
jgi:hypothetical protein